MLIRQGQGNQDIGEGANRRQCQARKFMAIWSLIVPLAQRSSHLRITNWKLGSKQNSVPWKCLYQQLFTICWMIMQPLLSMASPGVIRAWLLWWKPQWVGSASVSRWLHNRILGSVCLCIQCITILLSKFLWKLSLTEGKHFLLLIVF